MRHRFPALVTSALIVVLALAAAACGDDDGDTTPVDDGPTVDDSNLDPSDGDTGDAPVDDVEYEVFSSDEGAGCAVYVSVPDDAATGDLKAVVWRGIVAQEFSDCGFSDVVEVGLLTVNALDEYNQPDFGQSIEHAYYAVSGWEALVADCYSVELDETCAAQLQAALTE